MLAVDRRRKMFHSKATKCPAACHLKVIELKRHIVSTLSVQLFLVPPGTSGCVLESSSANKLEANLDFMFYTKNTTPFAS